MEGKSVANRAKKVVSDMHSKLDKQSSYVKDLENLVKDMQSMSTSPIETEIEILEKRKKQLQIELESTEKLILKYRKMLKDTRSRINGVVSESLRNGNDTRKIGKSVETSSLDKYEIAKPHVPIDVEEENDIVDRLREFDHRLLFTLHRNTFDDFIVYTSNALSESDSLLNSIPPDDTDSENTNGCDRYVSVYKVSATDPSESTKQPISAFEKFVAYGMRMCPVNDREDPTLMELDLSLSLPSPKGEEEGGKRDTPPPMAVVQGRGIYLFSAEIPLVSEVVVDLWRFDRKESTTCPSDAFPTTCLCPEYVATTTIQDTKNAVLSRVYVVSEVRWGLTTVIRVELHGTSLDWDETGSHCSMRNLVEAIDVE